MWRELVVIADAEQDVGRFGEVLDRQHLLIDQPAEITASTPIRCVFLLAFKGSLGNGLIDMMAPLMGQDRQSTELMAGVGLQTQATQQTAMVNAQLR